MTAAEVLLFLIILGIVFVIVYYFLRGSSGRVELTRPIESRIDEYLDQRFETLMAEWRLVSRSRVRRFESENTPQLQEAFVPYTRGLHSGGLSDIRSTTCSLQLSHLHKGPRSPSSVPFRSCLGSIA